MLSIIKNYNMNPVEKFHAEIQENIQHQSKDEKMIGITMEWLRCVSDHRYTHNYCWFGRPIIQFPQDMFAMQELIWLIKPDLIIETGIAGTIAKVHAVAANYSRVLVCLDSNHTHEHVLAELSAYAPLTSLGSYCVVFDTLIEDLPSEKFPDRPWAPGNNPKTAVWEYVKTHPEFEIDKSIQNKLLITVAPDGWLKRIK